MTPLDYTPYTLLSDVGWISGLLLLGKLIRRFIPVAQHLLLPAPITGGLLGILFGSAGLGWIPFSDQLNAYSSILIAVVFAAMPFSMEFSGKVAKGARTMWSYSTGMYVGQWGIAVLFGLIVLVPLFGTPDWFGMIMPVGWVGGFGTAAAVGAALDGDDGATVATTLGFTSATVGTLVAIIGGVIIAKWGSSTGRTSQMGSYKELPDDVRTGLISIIGERPSIGKGTSSPSSLEPLALHLSVIAGTTFVAYLVTDGIKTATGISIPMFAMAFVIGFIFRLILDATKASAYVDGTTVNSISGGATDYLVAFGIASIVPSIVVDYAVPLLLLFALGLVYCLLVFRFLSPAMFQQAWLERGLFGWGWATASVATGIALLKIVDPRMKSGTMEEFGVAYVGYAPFEIGTTILAPIMVTLGLTWAFGGIATVVAVVVIVLAFALGWVRANRDGEHEAVRVRT